MFCRVWGSRSNLLFLYMCIFSGYLNAENFSWRACLEATQANAVSTTISKMVSPAQLGMLASPRPPVVILAQVSPPFPTALLLSPTVV